MELYFLLFVLTVVLTCLASIITPRMPLPTLSSPRIQPRQITSFTSTCGFLDGDANIPRVAPSGSECRYDTDESVWGFCGIATTDLLECNIAVQCKDKGTCSSGCGESNVAGHSTQECSGGGPFCVNAILVAGVDQSYSFWTCAAEATRQYFRIFAMTTASRKLSTWSPPSAAATASPGSNPSLSSASRSASNTQSNAASKSASTKSDSSPAASKTDSSLSIATSISPSSPNKPRDFSNSPSSSKKSADSSATNSLSQKESIFTISGSIVTSFFGQTNTIGTTVSITTIASGTTSPSPSNSTIPALNNPPKYNFKALIGIVLSIVLGILFFLLLLVFTLIWIGKYRRARQKGSESSEAESPTNSFSNLPEVMAPLAKIDGLHEMYDDHEELRELDIAGAVAARPGRVSVRELDASPMVGGRRSSRRSVRKLEEDPAWGRGRISIKELDGDIFMKNGRRGEGMTQVFELDGQSYI